MLLYVILLLLFLTPLLVIPIGISAFETPKIIMVELGITVMFIVKILSGSLLIKSINKKYVICLLSLFVLTLIDLLFLRTEISFLGNPFRSQGILMLWFMLIFSLLSSRIVIRKTYWWLAIGTLIGLVTSSVILGTSQNNRWIGTLGEPNSLAGAILFLWPLVVLLEIPKLTKILLTTIILGSSIVTIIFADSRSGLIGIFIQLFFLASVFIFKLSIRKSIVISLILLTMTIFFPFLEGGKMFEDRTEIWKTALISGLSSPIFGGGFGNIEVSLKNTSIKLNNNIQYQYIDSSHNFILDWWVQGGITGLILLVLILYFSIKSFACHSSVVKLTSLLGIISLLSFNPVSIVIILYFWWIIGQGIGEDTG